MPTKAEWMKILSVPVSGADELRKLIYQHLESPDHSQIKVSKCPYPDENCIPSCRQCISRRERSIEEGQQLMLDDVRKEWSSLVGEKENCEAKRKFSKWLNSFDKKSLREGCEKGIKMKAFTLVELLVVIAIMAIVTTLLVPPIVELLKPEGYGLSRVVVARGLQVAWEKAVGGLVITKIVFSRSGEVTVGKVFKKTQFADPITHEPLWEEIDLGMWAIKLPEGIRVVSPDIDGYPDFAQLTTHLVFTRSGTLVPIYGGDVMFFLYDFNEVPPVMLEEVQVNRYSGRLLSRVTQ